MDWDEEEDLLPETPEEIYGNLRRSLQRQTGFELHFVVCDRAKELELFDRLRREIPEKRFAQLVLDRKDTTLLDKVKELAATTEFDVLFVRDLDATLLDYEDTKRQAGWSDVQIYEVDWRGVPPILQHLNWARETLRDQFPCAFIIGCRPTTMQYLSERAPDFFDWRLGIYRFPLEPSDIDQKILEESLAEDGYSNLSESECIKKLLELQDLIKVAKNSAQAVKLYLQIGKLNLRNQNYGSAVIGFTRVLSLDSGNYLAAFFRGVVLGNLGRYEEAIASYDQAIKTKPDYHEAWNNRGVALRKLEHYEGALASYNRAVKTKPDYYEAWNNRGNALGSLERYQDAIASYQEALTIKPDFYEALNNMGWALGKLGQYDAAVASYDRVLAIKPDYQEAQDSRRWALENLGKPDAVPGSYESALLSHPDPSQPDHVIETRGALPPGSLIRAINYLAQHTPKLELYERVIALNLDDYDTWLNRGWALWDLGCYQEAISSYDRALQLTLGDHKAWYGRSIALGDLGRYEEAISSYDQALRAKPDDHETWYGRGYALEMLERYEEAIFSYEQSIQLKPDRHIIWHSRGNALKKLERYEEAIASYDEMLLHQPDHYPTWHNRGGALEEMGRYKEAVASYDNAINIPSFSSWLSWSNRGNALRNLNRYEEAISSYDQALQLKPDFGNAQYGKAACYAIQDKVDVAIHQLRQAIKLNPKARDWAKTDSDFDPIRQDPRFQALIQEP